MIVFPAAWRCGAKVLALPFSRPRRSVAAVKLIRNPISN